MRLVGGQEILFGKLKTYIRDHLFETAVNLDDLNVLRNLSEIEPRRHLFETFAQAINELTLVDVGTTSVVSEIKISKTRPVVVNNQEFVQSCKTVFNRVIGDSNLELRFAKFLDEAKDVQAFAKNTRSLHFFIEYVNATGEISNYYPDFIVRTSPDQMFVIETKGLQDLDVAPKWKRLVQWCEDVTEIDPHSRTWTPLFVSQEDFDEIETKVKTMDRLAELMDGRVPVGA
jgi:type III restriction enzyme